MTKFDESLEYKRKNSWQYMTDETKKDVFDFCEDYKKFLDSSKTEREAVDTAIEMLRADGYLSLDEVKEKKLAAKDLPGTKLYYVHHNRCIFIAKLGKKRPDAGFNLIGAHVDCPRLDLKPWPFVEKNNFLYFRTHYYGGIKMYQWPTIPLALHGVIVKADGTKINFRIGEDEGDPKFMISDLLPHLGHAQTSKPANSFIDPEAHLNVIIGSMPGKANEDDPDDKPFTVKQSILTYLAEKYNITERDFINGELVITPADKAVDIGFDKALIAAYGHDDRVCAFTELRALLDMKKVPEKTAVAYFADKEEIGSVGVTGARSNSLELFTMEVASLYGVKETLLSTKRCLAASKMLSADVTAAFDPSYPEVYDETNAAFMAGGLAIEKYTGSGGKFGTSDAPAEFVAEITDIFDKKNVAWQINEMGKMNCGGGGTIAQYMADKGVEVIDCGVPLFSMHSPLELASKADIYWAYKGYLAFIDR
ncbi:MAG: aminopeptidase [Clostridia bacterium]|nr:aminopeptidase [Clostridia bacterium]